MNKFIQSYAIELILSIIGLITILASLFVGITKPSGIILTVITAISWGLSLNSINTDMKMKNTLDKIPISSEKISVIPKDEIYKKARTCIEEASTVKATFFAEYMWKLQPDERGYQDQVNEWGLTQEQVDDFDRYFNFLNTRLNGGNLEYHWITSINNYLKFYALIDRIKTALYKNEVAIKRGHVSIYTLPHSAKFLEGEKLKIFPPVPQIGLQIAYKKNVKEYDLLITPMRSHTDPSATLHVVNKDSEAGLAVDSFEQWFNFLRHMSNPIIHENAIYTQNVYLEGYSQNINSDNIEKEIEDLTYEMQKFGIRKA